MAEHSADELRTLRYRIEALATEFEYRRQAGTARGNPAIMGQVYDGGSLPTTSLPSYYLAHPITISGAEVEGGKVTITADPTITIPVAVEGSAKVGDNLVATQIDGRWVATIDHKVAKYKLCVDPVDCGRFPSNGSTITLDDGGSPPKILGTCSPSGSLISITVSDGGSWTSIPPLTITGDGTGAAATANMGVLTVAIHDPGVGYRLGDQISLVGGTRTSQARYTITQVDPLTGAILSLAALPAAAGSYSVLPANPVPTTVSSGPGVGATIDVLFWVIVSATITDAGTGYSFADISGDPTANQGLKPLAAVGAGGSGYSIGDQLTLVGGIGTVRAVVTVNAVNPFSRAVTAFAPITTNSGCYSVVPTNPVATTGGMGTGATVNADWQSIVPRSGLTATLSSECCFNLTNPGTYYITYENTRFVTNRFAVQVDNPGTTYTGAGSTAATGYRCCVCPEPTSETLWLTDGNGTWPCTFDGVAWQTGYNITRLVPVDCWPNYPNLPQDPPTMGMATVGVGYSFYCGDIYSGQLPGLTAFWYYVPTASGYMLSASTASPGSIAPLFEPGCLPAPIMSSLPGGAQVAGVPVAADSYSCTPIFSASFKIPTTGYQTAPPGGGSVAVSE